MTYCEAERVRVGDALELGLAEHPIEKFGSIATRDGFDNAGSGKIPTKVADEIEATEGEDEL